MNQWFKRLFFTVLFLLVGYVLTVQVLRWIAFGDEERDALAVMEAQTSPPTGEAGFKYLAYADLDVSEEMLDQALAADVAAFEAWHAGTGERMLGDGNVAGGAVPELPSESRYARIAQAPAPEAECKLREADCLATLRGNEAQVRTWLDAEARRLRLAEQALASGHLQNPYPYNAMSPLANFQLLRLPINDIALQALEGDVAGALPRACGLLADSRRHLRNDGMLIDKMVMAALVEGAGNLLVSLRQADPTLPLPAECAPALAPVLMDDYQVCGAMRTEFAMMSELSRQMHGAMTGWRLPTRWVLYSDKLQRGWTAAHFAPMCSAEGRSAIARGELPDIEVREFSRATVDFWAAPISHILASISLPAYGDYQKRLLDHAQVLRGHLATIEATTAVPEPQPEA